MGSGVQWFRGWLGLVLVPYVESGQFPCQMEMSVWKEADV